MIDRLGYNERYAEQYNANPWMLCKTAFCVVVERAVKLSVKDHRRLRVHPEKCNRKEDNALKRYYADLKQRGMPFDAKNSERYAPLSNEEFSHAFYELKFKEKSSPLAQLADLYLWPICMGGYHRANRTYQRLMEDGKLIECHISGDEHAILGTKYSCFENVEVKN